MINCIPLVSFVLVSLEIALGDGQQIARTIQYAVYYKFEDIIVGNVLNFKRTLRTLFQISSETNIIVLYANINVKYK